MMVVATSAVLRRAARFRVALWGRMRLLALRLLEALLLLGRLEVPLLLFETLLRWLEVALLHLFLSGLCVEIRPWAIVVAFETRLLLSGALIGIFLCGAVELRRAGQGAGFGRRVLRCGTGPHFLGPIFLGIGDKACARSRHVVVLRFAVFDAVLPGGPAIGLRSASIRMGEAG